MSITIYDFREAPLRPPRNQVSYLISKDVPAAKRNKNQEHETKVRLKTEILFEPQSHPVQQPDFLSLSLSVLFNGTKFQMENYVCVCVALD